MADLPNWVLDLVADLLDEEDNHPKLLADMYVTAAGKHQVVQYSWCPAVPLKRVPDDVMTAARAIQGYRPKPTQDDDQDTCQGAAP